MPEKKLYYIDRIKVLMTVLVVLHHTAIAYGAPGGWYYSEKTSLLPALVPMTTFVAVNQSFFMGFFFLLAAFFVPASYDRKGASKFLSDRLLRLGIPLVFYSFLFSPLLSYLVYYFAKNHHITYLQYLGGFDSWIDFGVLWFALALLLFTILYVFVRSIFKTPSKKKIPVPRTGSIVLFALMLGIISFFVRIIFPVGWVLQPLGFQPGHFTQYIALFIAGIVAFRNDWFNQLSNKTGKQLGFFAIVLLVLFPLLFIIKIRMDFPIDWFSGGLHWQSLLYSLWEQCIGISLVTAILVTGKKYWNNTSLFVAALSRSAFAVYIFHPIVIISISMALRNWPADPSVKFLIAAPLAVLGSFVLGSIICRIPGVKKIV